MPLAVYPEKIVDLHLSIFHVALYFHLLAHVVLDHVGVADFCGLALLVDKNYVTGFIGAIRVARSRLGIVIDAFGIAYPAGPFNRMVLVLSVCGRYQSQN
jgi:hypothetical protein